MDERAVRRMQNRRTAIVLMAAAAVMTATGARLAAQTPADVAGEWVLTVETDQGTTTPSVTLEQNGATLSGHYSSETLGEAEVEGTVNGRDVEFSMNAEVGGYALEVTYTATLQEDGTLSGAISLGGYGGGSFTGKKR